MKVTARWFVVLSVVVAAALPVAAAPRQRAVPGTPGSEAAVTPAEIQRMFDAFALLQAQEQLKISDEQYTQFLTRFKALQDVRRQALQQRTRVIQELRKLVNDAQSDEAQMKERLKQLADM